jgi:hypothetical protein
MKISIMSVIILKKVFFLLVDKMEEEPKGIARIKTLYLLGEYSRRLGKAEDARKYFDQVKMEEYKDEEGQLNTDHPLFLEINKDREKLIKTIPTPAAKDRTILHYRFSSETSNTVRETGLPLSINYTQIY